MPATIAAAAWPSTFPASRQPRRPVSLQWLRLRKRSSFHTMKTRFRGLVAASTFAAVAFAAAATIDPSQYLSDVKFLASPELRGRNTGSPELTKAAAWLEKHYRQLGIKPA